MDINKKNRSDLKSYFVKNSIPTESNFAELIDGMLNQKDDGIVKLPGDPLSIEAGDPAGLQKVINFYTKLQDANPAWSLQLNPRTDANAASKAGFCVVDGAGAARLFIDKATGNIGIGTLTPIARLDIVQAARSGAHPTAIKGLYITGDFGPDADGVEFRHSNGTQGLGFGYNTIYAAGSNADQDLQLKPKGAGVMRVSSSMHVVGAARISDSNGDANANKFMSSGSLTIGSTNARYGGGNGWNASTAGLLLEALEYTEIAVHERNHSSLTSLMYYQGDGINKISIGRSMGPAWGVTPVTIAGNLTVNGAITPSAGNAEANGILFPKDPGGGGGDAAWLRYYARTGEAMTLELGTSNDPGDHIALMPSGGVGVGTNTPAEKLDVNGRIKTGALTVGPWPANAGSYVFFGSNALDQSNAGNYALLQDINNGTTFLNSPVSLQFRIGNADKMVLGNDGALRINGSCYAGNSDIYFSRTDHNHSGIGNTLGMAAIENAANYNCLMILGRTTGKPGAALDRKVELWDSLKVNGTFINNSDRNAKKDIEDLHYGLAAVRKLRPVSFNWNEIYNPHKSLGLIAQEVRDVITEVIYEDDSDVRKGALGVSYINLIPVLINAIKELDAQINR
jgi:hypothetical protein